MRDVKKGATFPLKRSMHKYSGLLLYFVSKTKLFFLLRIEQAAGVLFPNSPHDLQYYFVAYVAVLVLVWLTIIIIHTALTKKFRHKEIQDNTGFFNAQLKSSHVKLLDIQNDHMVPSLLTAARARLQQALPGPRVGHVRGPRFRHLGSRPPRRPIHHEDSPRQGSQQMARGRVRVQPAPERCVSEPPTLSVRPEHARGEVRAK